jgi:hypothetical protein
LWTELPWQNIGHRAIERNAQAARVSDRIQTGCGVNIAFPMDLDWLATPTSLLAYLWYIKH